MAHRHTYWNHRTVFSYKLHTDQVPCQFSCQPNKLLLLSMQPPYLSLCQAEWSDSHQQCGHPPVKTAVIRQTHCKYQQNAILLKLIPGFWLFKKKIQSNGNRTYLHGSFPFKNLYDIQLVKKFPYFWGTKRFIMVLMKAHHLPILSQLNHINTLVL